MTTQPPGGPGSSPSPFPPQSSPFGPPPPARDGGANGGEPVSNAPGDSYWASTAPGSPPPPAPYPPYGAPAPQRGRDGFAVAALVLSIFAVVPLSFIFAIVALVRIRRSGAKGKVMALFALLITALWTVAIVALVVFALSIVDDVTREDTSTTGAAPNPTSSDSFLFTQIKTGDCLKGIRAEVVTKVTAVPCAQQHEAQAVATFELAAGDYPGAAQAQKLADEGCAARIPANILTLAGNGTVQIMYLYPQEATWALGRGVSCLASLPGDKIMTGSLSLP